MTVATPKELLQRHGLSAKKSWGQNFLSDPRVYAAIVAACEVTPGRPVVEIGAGLGTLTARLLDAGACVTAVERDRDMCAVLRAELGERPGFTLVEDNALTVDYGALGGEGPVAVGNLPYHIAAPILFRLLDRSPPCSRIVIMVQREVADRMLAQVGDEDYSAMSVNVQLVAAARRVCHVGPGSFVPPPRVQSTVVLLLPRAEPLYGVRDVERVRAVVRAAFGQRRKTLRNAIAAVYGDAALPGLAAAGIDPQRRGETLTLEEFTRLAAALPTPMAGAAGAAGDEEDPAHA